MNKKIAHWIVWIVVSLATLIGISILSLSVGSAAIPLRKILFIIREGKGSIEHTIIFNIRLPRIILGFAIGGALSLAGVILQGMFRNPLVEPYTLGISGGAAIGVSVSIILQLHNSFGLFFLPLSGFLGSVIVIVLVYSLSIKRGVMKTQGLLLTGVMISFISSSLLMLIMSISRIEDLHGIIFWIMGSLEEPNWFLIKLALVISVAGLVVSYFFCFDLNALSLGEEEALHLGINIENSKRILLLIASLLTGFSVSVAGIIGFVGLVVPHFVRMFVGSDHRILIISSFIFGAGFLIFCDTLSRTIVAPIELPVGVITGIVGGSLFVYALNKKNIVLGEK
ncbi:MAG: FecCD family ABC transporter permease [bacterium]